MCSKTYALQSSFIKLYRINSGMQLFACFVIVFKISLILSNLAQQT